MKLLNSVNKFSLSQIDVLVIHTIITEDFYLDIINS